MRRERIKQTLNDLSDVGCEEEDIVYAMREEVEFSRSWINDSILRCYIRKTGDKRLSADTRELIKVKSYDTYISFSEELQRDLMKQIEALKLGIQNK